MSRRDARWTVAPRYDLQRVPIPLSAAARRWHSRGLWRRASLRVVPPLPGCRPHSGASDAARFGAALGIGPPDEVLARRPRYVAGGLYHRLVRAAPPRAPPPSPAAPRALCGAPPPSPPRRFLVHSVM